MSVWTRGKKFLGRVVDISFDTDSHSVLQYHVRVPHLLARAFPFLFKSNIIFISHTQIIQWKEKEIIVEDILLKMEKVHRVISGVQQTQEALHISSCSSTDRAAPS